jgi:hypothetical protein
VSEWVAWPTSARDARSLESDRRRCIEALAARTIWCATLGDGLGRARSLSAELQRTGWLDVSGPAPLEPERQLDGVAPDDVVVLHDAPAAQLAEAARERGAHVVLNLGAVGEVRFAVHAYLMSWTAPGTRGTPAERVAALIAAPRVLAERPLSEAPRRPMGLSSVLAEVVTCDRSETVGGTLRPRPGVAVR